MKQKCAWCGKILSDDGSTDAAVPVSHGMCHPLCDEAKAMGWSDDVTVKVPDTNKPLIASIVAGLLFGCLTASANPAQPLSSVGQPVKFRPVPVLADSEHAETGLPVGASSEARESTSPLLNGSRRSLTGTLAAGRIQFMSAWRNVKPLPRVQTEEQQRYKVRASCPDGAGSNPAALISQSFLSRVEQIESGGNARAIGDGGKARGSFQFHAAAWQMVNNSRAVGHRPQARYESHAHDRMVAREFAFEYFTILHRQFVKHGRTPTHADLYAAWNLGFAGYKKRGFDLRRCPEITRRACAKF